MPCLLRSNKAKSILDTFLLNVISSDKKKELELFLFFELVKFDNIFAFYNAILVISIDGEIILLKGI
jgi:hypothetical protein